MLVNGGLNLSELDGWWAEAYTPDVGWALGDGRDHGDDSTWDAAEAAALYDRLEREVIPEFYTRDANGIPVQWVARARESMARLAPQFSSNRTVREYTERHYLPAAEAYRMRTAEKGAFGATIVELRQALKDQWGMVRIGQVTVATTGGQHIYEAQAFLADIAPKRVRVGLYADGLTGGDPVRHAMACVRPLAGEGGYLYRGAVAADRPTTEFTARVIPDCPGVAIPLEMECIVWQR